MRQILPSEPPLLNPVGWILVVDDEPVILHMIHRALTRFGYAVTACSSRAEALGALARSPQPPALIITDLLLNDGGGGDVIESAKARHAGVGVILMSGIDEQELEGESHAADVFLSKPFRMEELLSSVRSLITGRG